MTMIKKRKIMNQSFLPRMTGLNTPKNTMIEIGIEHGKT